MPTKDEIQATRREMAYVKRNYLAAGTEPGPGSFDHHAIVLNDALTEAVDALRSITEGVEEHVLGVQWPDWLLFAIERNRSVLAKYPEVTDDDV